MNTGRHTLPLGDGFATQDPSARSPCPRSGGPPISSRSFLLFASRWSCDGRGARLPLLAFSGRGPTAVSPSLPAPVDSASGDPMPNSSGEGGGLGSPRRPSPGCGASSLRSRTRARPRGLSIVLGSSVRPDSTRRGHISSSLASSDSCPQAPPGALRPRPSGSPAGPLSYCGNSPPPSPPPGYTNLRRGGPGSPRLFRAGPYGGGPVGGGGGGGGRGGGYGGGPRGPNAWCGASGAAPRPCNRSSGGGGSGSAGGGNDGGTGSRTAWCGPSGAAPRPNGRSSGGGGGGGGGGGPGGGAGRRNSWGGASGAAPCPRGRSSRGSTRRPSTPLVGGGLALVSPRGGGGGRARIRRRPLPSPPPLRIGP